MDFNKTGIIKLSKNQVKQAAKVYARAFYEGPIYKCFIPNEEKRKKNLHVIFESFVCYSMRYGNVYTTSENLEGIISVVPSEEAKISALKMIRCGAWKIPGTGKS